MSDMNAKLEATKEQIKQQVIKSHEELAAALDRCLHQAIDDALSSIGPQTGEDASSENAARGQRNAGLAGFAVRVIGILLIAAYLSSNASTLRASPFSAPENTLRYMLTYLGFVVALSSYLAGVIRESVKTISASKARDKDELKVRRNIYRVAVAEVCLVIAGLLAIARIAFGPAIEPLGMTQLRLPLSDTPFDLDAFLVAHLITTLTYLAIVHTIIWCQERPWAIK